MSRAPVSAKCVVLARLHACPRCSSRRAATRSNPANGEILGLSSTTPGREAKMHTHAGSSRSVHNPAQFGRPLPSAPGKARQIQHDQLVSGGIRWRFICNDAAYDTQDRRRDTMTVRPAAARMLLARMRTLARPRCAFRLIAGHEGVPEQAPSTPSTLRLTRASKSAPCQSCHHCHSASRESLYLTTSSSHAPTSLCLYLLTGALEATLLGPAVQTSHSDHRHRSSTFTLLVPRYLPR